MVDRLKRDEAYQAVMTLRRIGCKVVRSGNMHSVDGVRISGDRLKRMAAAADVPLGKWYLKNRKIWNVP